MQTTMFNITSLVVLLFTTLYIPLKAQVSSEASPVRISFDSESKRIDLLTGKETPAYEYAQRGSIQFFLWDINKPQNFITYMHDGIRTMKIADLTVMEKKQKQFAVWKIAPRTGGVNTPRIRELAVAFIPLSVQGTGSQKVFKPESRVYLRLNDLNLIEWGENK